MPASVERKRRAPAYERRLRLGLLVRGERARSDAVTAAEGAGIYLGRDALGDPHRCRRLLSACGGGSAQLDETSGNRSTSEPASEAAPPATPKPTLAGLSDGPPAAWLETEGGSFWFGYSSYCWKTVCADFIAPSCDDPKHTPAITLRRGEVVTAHLGFEPTEFGLSYFSGTGGPPESQEKLEPTRMPSWRVQRDGAFSLFARAQRGDASYVACAEFM